MASRSLDDLAPSVRLAALQFLELCKLRGLDVLIYCTMRSHAEQDDLYRRGMTRALAGQSLHNPQKPTGKARAFDAVPLVNGVPDWQDKTKLKAMGECGEAAGLKWSGRWIKFPELVHFEGTHIMNEIDGTNTQYPQITKPVTPTGYAVERLKEPSSWAGLSVLVGLIAKIFFPQYAAAVEMLAAALAAFAVVQPEGKK